MPAPLALLPVPRSAPARRAELERLERELAGVESRRGRRVLAIERRRVLLELDRNGELTR